MFFPLVDGLRAAADGAAKLQQNIKMLTGGNKGCPGKYQRLM
jgi:hypothetical protein